MPKTGWTHAKRLRARRASEFSVADIEMLGIEMSQYSAAPRPLALSPFVHDMDQPGARVSCIRQLWAGEYFEAVGSLAHTNPELALLVHVCTINTYRPADAEAYAKAAAVRLKVTADAEPWADIVDILWQCCQKHL